MRGRTAKFIRFRHSFIITVRLSDCALVRAGSGILHGVSLDSRRRLQLLAYSFSALAPRRVHEFGLLTNWLESLMMARRNHAVSRSLHSRLLFPRASVNKRSAPILVVSHIYSAVFELIFSKRHVDSVELVLNIASLRWALHNRRSVLCLLDEGLCRLHEVSAH